MANQLLQKAWQIASRNRKPNEALYRTLGRDFGPAGALLGGLMDIFRVGGRVRPDDMKRATSVMRDAGFSMSPGEVKAIRLGEPYEPIEPDGVGRDGRFRVNVTPTATQPESPPFPQVYPETMGDIYPFPSRDTVPDANIKQPERRTSNLVKRPGVVEQPGRRAGVVYREPLDPAYNEFNRGALMPTKEGEEDVFANEIMTPESSNVFSFTYDEKRGVLYVTFKAPGDITHKTDQINGCTGEEYKMGHRQQARGPMYAYGSAGKPVPKALFEEMKGANSKGQFVWQRLRVCGSLWEHQYPYSLVSPSMAGTLYVPRRVTRKGFRVRAVPTVGLGRRPYVVSNLPEQLRD